jgi:hypothetical protein
VKVDKRFPLHVAIIFVGALLLAAIPLANMGADVRLAVLVGAVLSTLNVLSGFLAIEYSFDRSYNTFLKAVLGGIGVRMMVTLGTLVLLIKFSALHTIALVVSVLSFYVFYLVLEILYIQKKVSHKN